jgi:hypothetical protein
MKLIRPVILIGFIILSNTATKAQTPNNFTGWYGFDNYHPFYKGGRWAIALEGYVERNNLITDPLALFFRGGVGYTLKNGGRIVGGYCIQYNYPYDEASLPYSWADHRIWENYQKKWVYHNKSSLINRFRMEQRWLERKTFSETDTTTRYEFENTFSYLFRYNRPFSEKIFGILFDEVFLRIPPKSAERILDQKPVICRRGNLF